MTHETGHVIVKERGTGRGPWHSPEFVSGLTHAYAAATGKSLDSLRRSAISHGILIASPFPELQQAA
jgi:hypothetical protein